MYASYIAIWATVDNPHAGSVTINKEEINKRLIKYSKLVEDKMETAKKRPSPQRVEEDFYLE